MILFILLFLVTWAQQTNELVPFSAKVNDVKFTDLSQTLIVGTLDGTVCGLNSQTGEKQWSFSTGRTIFSSSHHPIIPGIDGTIHVFTINGSESFLKEYPTNVKDLVDQSPLSLGGDTIFLGSKQTSLFIVDPYTGEVHVCHSPEQHGGCTVPPDAIFLGRVDYTVKAIDQVTHEELWNLTLAEYTSTFQAPQDFGLNRTSLLSDTEGQLTLVDHTGKVIWATQLSSPTVYHHYQQDTQPIHLFFQEQVLIPDSSSKVFVAEYDGGFFGLPASNRSSIPPSLGPNVTDIIRILPLHFDNEWMVTLRQELQFLKRGEGGQMVRWVEDCSPGSALYPRCLIGYHERVCTPEQRPNQIIEYSGDFDYSWLWESPVFLAGVVVCFLAGVLGVFYLRSRKPVPPIVSPIKSPKKPSTPKKPLKPLKPMPIQRIEPQIPEDVPEPEPIKNVLKLGGMEVYLDKILGYGSSGTVVYRGSWNGRNVAIKRMLNHFYDVAQSEINILIGSDEHPNILRYFAQAQDEEFVYLALFFCPMTLDDYVKNNTKMRTTQLKTLLKEMIAGVAHLHSLNIVHRDLKPQNILVDESGHIKISDMGVARRLNQNQNSFSTEKKGTEGWQPPELIVEGQSRRQTKSVDIFSIGCLIHYVLTGLHPFGKPYEQQHRILLSQSQLKTIREKDVEAHDLISKCISKLPTDRPTIIEVMHHMFFWDADKKLQFLKDSSDKLEFENKSHPLVVKFEKNALGVIGADWNKRLDQELLKDLKKYRKYDGRKLRDLLRVIRNKAHHFRDLPIELQKELGAPPTGFLNYFQSAFPTLLIYVYNFMLLEQKETSDPNFVNYFGL